MTKTERDPRIDPISGDVVERDGVTRTVLEIWDGATIGMPERFSVLFLHQKRGREEEATTGTLSLAKWRDRTVDATIIRRGDDPRDVTQADRDELRAVLWDVIREGTRHWIDRDRELHDVLLGMACDVQYAIDETTNTE